MRHPGIVDQHIQRAEVGENSFHILFASHIRLQGPAGDAIGSLQMPRKLIQDLYGIAAGKGQSKALCRESFRNGLTYTPGCAGDQGAFSE